MYRETLVSKKQWKEGKEGGIEEEERRMTKGENGRGEYSTPAVSGLRKQKNKK